MIYTTKCGNLRLDRKGEYAQVTHNKVGVLPVLLPLKNMPTQMSYFMSPELAVEINTLQTVTKFRLWSKGTWEHFSIPNILFQMQKVETSIKVDKVMFQIIDGGLWADGVYQFEAAHLLMRINEKKYTVIPQEDELWLSFRYHAFSIKSIIGKFSTPQE